MRPNVGVIGLRSMGFNTAPEHTESIIAQLAPRLDGADVLVDMYRTATLPANLVQAQRDFFGAHGFERIDAGGHIHRDWQAVRARAL